MTETIIPFPARPDAPVTTMPRSEFGLRARALSEDERRIVGAAMDLAEEADKRMESHAKTHTVQRSFERDMRAKRIDKGLELDAAARLEGLAVSLAHEAEIARNHFRSDDFVSLREMQSILETMAAAIRAEHESFGP